MLVLKSLSQSHTLMSVTKNCIFGAIFFCFVYICLQQKLRFPNRFPILSSAINSLSAKHHTAHHREGKKDENRKITQKHSTESKKRVIFETIQSLNCASADERFLSGRCWRKLDPTNHQKKSRNPRSSKGYRWDVMFLTMLTMWCTDVAMKGKVVKLGPKTPLALSELFGGRGGAHWATLNWGELRLKLLA